MGTLLLLGLPALMSAGLAFASYDALSPPVWVGFRNFRVLAADPLVGVAVTNTLMFVLLAVPLRVLGALALALLLNRDRRGVGGYRAAVYLPTVIPDVAFALIWLWVFNPLYGPVNQVLAPWGCRRRAGSQTRIPRSTHSWSCRCSRSAKASWCSSWACAGISRDYYDAGAVDGGSPLRLFRWITLPLLAPWLLLLTFRDVIVVLGYTFTPSVVMTGGDPYYSTLFLPLLIFEEAFDRFRFGMGSALMLLLFLLTAAPAHDAVPGVPLAGVCP